MFLLMYACLLPPCHRASFPHIVLSADHARRSPAMLALRLLRAVLCLPLGGSSRDHPYIYAIPLWPGPVEPCRRCNACRSSRQSCIRKAERARTRAVTRACSACLPSFPADCKWRIALGGLLHDTETSYRNPGRTSSQ